MKIICSCLFCKTSKGIRELGFHSLKKKKKRDSLGRSSSQLCPFVLLLLTSTAASPGLTLCLGKSAWKAYCQMKIWPSLPCLAWTRHSESLMQMAGFPRTDQWSRETVPWQAWVLGACWTKVQKIFSWCRIGDRQAEHEFLLLLLPQPGRKEPKHLPGRNLREELGCVVLACLLLLCLAQ